MCLIKPLSIVCQLLMITERRQERMMNENEGTSTEISSEIPKTIFEKNISPGLQKQTN